MAKPTLTLGKMQGGIYKLNFSTDDGTLLGQFSVAKRGGAPDTRSDEQKKQEVLRKIKLLAKALDAAIEETGA